MQIPQDSIVPNGTLPEGRRRDRTGLILLVIRCRGFVPVLGFCRVFRVVTMMPVVWISEVWPTNSGPRVDGYLDNACGCVPGSCKSVGASLP